MAVPYTNLSPNSRITIEKNGRNIALTIEGSVALVVAGLSVMSYFIHLIW